MSFSPEHNCQDFDVEFWGTRHVQPKEYAVRYSSLDSVKGPQQAQEAAKKMKLDLARMPRTRRIRLHFGSSELPRAVQTTGLLLEDITRWVKEEEFSHITIDEGVEFCDFLQTTNGPSGLIIEPRWLSGVTDIDERRARAYLDWLLGVQESRLREWGLQTPGEVEYNSVASFIDQNHRFQNDYPGDKTVVIGGSHEPLHGSLLRRYTRNPVDLGIKYGERIKACPVHDGVFLHWRNMPAKFTRLSDVLGNLDNIETNPFRGEITR